MLLVHYADLKRDREGEMRRVAEFLEIDIDEDLWPELVEAAGFEAMKRHGNKLIPMAAALWGADGAARFFNKGMNGRWQTAFSAADLERYEHKVRERFSAELAEWLENGSGASQPA